MAYQEYVYPSSLRSSTISAAGENTTTHASQLAFTAFHHLHVTGERSDIFNVKGSAPKKTEKIIGTVFLQNTNIPRTYEHDFAAEESGLIGKMIQAFHKSGGVEGTGLSAALGTAMQGLITGETGEEILHDDFNQIINKNVFTRYTGTKPRSQDISFTLIARDADELRSIGNIIKFFKRYSAPSRVNVDKSKETISALSDKNGVTYVQEDTTSSIAKSFNSILSGNRLNIPALWTVEEVNLRDTIRYIDPFRFGPAFLSRVMFSPGGDDEMLFTFANGDPVIITLSLTFQEVAPLYAEDIESLGF